MRSTAVQLAIGLLSALGAQAANLTYNFNFTWVSANPDGLYDRPTIGINGQWPVPVIEGTVGDHVVVNVQNQLGNRSSSLHFHGLYMNGSTQYDGPVGTSQCAIPDGSSFTYEFDLKQPGSYWYHAHNDGMYPDGLRGPLIIHDPKDPYKDEYDEELILTLSDWYHDFMPDLISGFINLANPTGAEPVPDAALMNDTQNLQIEVKPNKTYKIRIINMAAFAAQYIWFEGHTMRVIEVDGIDTEAQETDMIYITAAQRYSVLITTKNDTSANFPIVGSMDQDLFDTVPDTLNPNVTGWLVYDKTADMPDPQTVDGFDDALDDFTLVPHDGEELYDHVDQSIVMNFKMDNLGDGANYAFINEVSFVAPKVPSLYSVLSSGDSATNPAIYGSNTNAFVLDAGQVVEIVLNSDDPGKHPFHLHGHNFQAVWRGEENDGPYANNGTLSKVPMRRDTFMVRPQSNIVLRFKADNPGVWLFHCHIEWHIDSGLVATLIEVPLALQAQNLTIPASHYDACKAQGLPTEGNAAGNTKDLLDLSGQNTGPGPLPDGFTARGIVALVFSCVSAFLGMAFIVWYGAGEIKTPAMKQG